MSLLCKVHLLVPPYMESVMPRNYDGIESQKRAVEFGTPYRADADRVAQQRLRAAEKAAEAEAKAQAAETLH